VLLFFVAFNLNCAKDKLGDYTVITLMQFMGP